MAATETADADESDEYEQRAWANWMPTVRLVGEAVEIFTPQQLDGDKEQTDSSYGIVVRNPRTVIGETFVNEGKPDDGLTRDIVDEDSSNPTDYRLADDDDKDASFDRDGNFQTDEESVADGEPVNTYQSGDFEEDEVLLWVSGLAGERIIRALDINGRPFAKYTDGGNYIAGLFQAHDEWFSDKSAAQVAKEGKAPRLAHPPTLRPDVEGVELLFDLTRGSGRGYRGHVFRADEFESEFGDLTTPTSDLPTGQYGIDADSRLDLRMMDFDAMDEWVDGLDYNVHAMFYEGDGWGEQPDDIDTSSGFDVSVSTGSDSGPDDSEQDETFTQVVVDVMKNDEDAHGRTPDDAFKNGISGLVEKHADEWDEPPTGERLDDIERSVYTNVPWLDAEDLE